MGQVPRISVILPVYNGEKYLSESIHSLFAQTFTDFEVVVIDDGSEDDTQGILSRFSDARLRIIRLSQHQGLVSALNTGIRESASQFIARMDADDISMPRRFERQLAFLHSHPEIAICGTWARTFGRRRRLHRVPVKPEDVHARLFFGGAMDHSSLMMRRAFLQKHSLTYTDNFPYAEDFDLLSRAAEFTKLANLGEFLLLYREHQRQVSVLWRQEQEQAEIRLQARQLRSLIPDATSEEESFHLCLLRGRIEFSSLVRAERWLLRLDRINRAKSRYDVTAFRRELCRKWYYAHSNVRGLRGLVSYWKSPLGNIWDVGLGHHALMVAGCLITRPASIKMARSSGL